MILSALNEKIIVKGGGHKMAGGFTIDENKIEILFLQFSFIALIFIFYCYFWKFNKGQTLGMQVWKIKLVGTINETISLKTMIFRCFLSLLFSILFLSNFIFIIFNKERKTIGDYFSGTRILRVY